MLRLHLKRTIDIPSDPLMGKEDWDKCFEGNLPALIEFFDEDVTSLLGDMGGLEHIIEKVEWIEEELCV